MGDMRERQSESVDPDATTLAGRIATVRAAAKLSQSGLAQRLGITRGAVGQWESGATEPSDANLRRVAHETGARYEWLATGRGDARIGQMPWPSDNFVIPLAGTLEAGVFRSVELENKESRLSQISADLRYLEVPQYAWEVRGDSMNMAGIDDGMYIVATTAHDFREKYGPIKMGSFVIVQRLRGHEAAERELSVKEYVPLETEIELRPRSANQAHRSYYYIPLGANPRQLRFGIPPDDDIQVIGVVLSAIRTFNPCIGASIVQAREIPT
jgi:transcriptional regulator with XRE-family HTH domain